MIGGRSNFDAQDSALTVSAHSSIHDSLSMFKKPPKNWKTSSPLRNSDRKKLKQRIVSAFGLKLDDSNTEAAEIDILPEGTLSLKFITHLDEPGVAYLSPTGDPLWFSIGRGQDESLIPTVYTLWKHPKLLPFVTTTRSVIPIIS